MRLLPGVDVLAPDVLAGNVLAGNVLAGNVLADALAVERPPPRLPERLLLTALVLVVIVLACWAMLRSWRRRAVRQEVDLPPLPVAPDPLPPAVAPAMEGVYVGTVGDGGWQDRVVARGLGARRGGALVVTREGVDLAGLWVPLAALRSVEVGPGLAGKVMPGTGLLIVTWQHGGRVWASGFRGVASRYDEVLAAVDTLIVSGKGERA